MRIATPRQVIYFLVLSLGLGLFIWFATPSDRPRLMILIVVEAGFLGVALYQAWILALRRKAQRSRDQG
jgi:hypothetical protein